MIRNKTSKIGYLDISNLEISAISEPIRGSAFSTSYYVDISHNTLSNASFLKDYPNIIMLTADYNSFSSLDSFPSLSQLESLSMNHNQLADMTEVLSNISTKFPNLEHLIIFNNPCNSSIHPDPQNVEFCNYRLRIINRLKRLQSLDGLPVTNAERISAMELAEKEKVSVYKVRSEPEPAQKAAREFTPGMFYGFSSSEGNKFISNEDL